MSTSRRDFLRQAGTTALVATAAGKAHGSPSDRVNVAVVGFHSRGGVHLRSYAQMPNVRIAALCDVDERLFGPGIAEVEKLSGHRPDTEYDMRRLLDRKDIDAISIASPDYWHALHTIWACQAGKDVYVEKPVSFTVLEGRHMVEAARKYNRIVQAGTQRRSDPASRAAVRVLHEGKIGKVYRASTDFSKPRASIGRQKEAPVPQGVHWDLFLGPSPERPFTLNHFHYGWHYFWETSTSEIGNTGVHSLDLCRWGLGQKTHPVEIYCAGGKYVWDSEQETPNLQLGTVKYADGSIINLEVTSLFGPQKGETQVFYGSKGYVTTAGGWKGFAGKLTPRNRPHPSGTDETTMGVSFPDASWEEIPIERPETPRNEAGHFANFVDAVRSRKVEDLHCDIAEGHLSSSLSHLSTISYRLGRKLTFNPDTETFVGDAEANQMLTRKYRKPHTLPDKV